MKRYDITIAGAGISGLCLAHYCLKKAMTVGVIEGSDRIGGAFNSHQFTDRESDNFWIELGAHTCYNSYTKLLGIVEDCGLLPDLIPREKVPFRVFADGKIGSIPSQINFPELLISLPRLFFAKKEGASIKEYYSRVLGRRNYNKLFNYFFNAVPSQEASDFPADMLFKKRTRRKDIIKSYTFIKGLQSIVEAIGKQDGIEIIPNQRISELKMDEEGYQMISSQGERFSSRYIGLATSAQQAAEILSSHKPEVSEALQKIGAESIETIGVIVPKDDLELEKVAGIIPLDGGFFSAVSRDTVADKKLRGFTFHFKAGELKEDEKMEIIGEVLGISTSKIKNSVSCTNLVTSPRKGHHQIVDRIDQLIKDENILITGNYFKGVSIEDCVVRSFDEAGRVTS